MAGSREERRKHPKYEDICYADTIRALFAEVRWEDGPFVVVSIHENGEYDEEYTADQSADHVG